MKDSVWYCPKFNCFGILTEFTDGGLQFEIETKSGPVEGRVWLDLLDLNWVKVGVL
jgi:hypothetical protein